MKKTLLTTVLALVTWAVPAAMGEGETVTKTKVVNFSDLITTTTQWTQTLNPTILSTTSNTSADNVKKAFTTTNSFSSTGIYWGSSNGQNPGADVALNPTLDEETLSNAFKFIGRQGYGGEYCGVVVKVGELTAKLTENGSALTSVQLSGTRRNWAGVVFSVWSISADKTTVSNMQSVGTMATMSTAGGTAYSSNDLAVAGLVADDYILFLYGQSSGGQQNYFWDNQFTLTYTAPAAGEGSVPEPATATLSLLALAGLAARRRRK